MSAQRGPVWGGRPRARTRRKLSCGTPLAGGGAVLRFYDKEGRECCELVPLTDLSRAGAPNDPAVVYLDAITNGAMTEGLLCAAGWHLGRLGYNYARGAQWAAHEGSEGRRWQWAEWAPMLPDGHRSPRAARVALVMTAEHVAYREALYGPVPELPPLPAGMTAGPSGARARWSVCFEDRLFLTLTWQPVMGGERGRIWTGPNATKLHSTHHRAPEVLEALTSLFAAKDTMRAKRECG